MLTLKKKMLTFLVPALFALFQSVSAQTVNLGIFTSGGSHGIKTGNVLLKDDKTLIVNGFHYDGRAPKLSWILSNSEKVKNLNSSETLSGEEYVIIQTEKGSQTILDAYTNATITLKSKSDKFTSYKYLALYCFGVTQTLAYLNLKAEGNNKANNEKFPSDGVGEAKSKDLGIFTSGGSHGIKTGNVLLKDDKTLIVNGFHYDGRAPKLSWILSNSEKVKNLNSSETLSEEEYVIIQTEKGGQTIMDAYANATITLESKSVNFTSYKYLALHCFQAKKTFAYLNLKAEASSKLRSNGLATATWCATLFVPLVGIVLAIF
ncbi:protein Skeletor, isoforms B/C-like [Zophobas morio]|uniref:protein Skeletor, isoforms B/C-like n=1 Tax=Zophobas morio TaxID=2755281 RepID=UPI003082F52A